MNISENPYWWETEKRIPVPSDLIIKDKNTLKKYDLVVIGGGFTGLSAAITSSKLGAKVLIIDSGIPGQGASTRNGGMLGAPHKINFTNTVKLYGESTARELLLEGIEGYKFTKNLIVNELEDTEFKNYGRLRLAWSKNDFLELEKDIDEAKRLAKYDVKIIKRDHLKHYIGSSNYYGAALFKDHGGVNPMKFHNALMKKAINLKVNFLINSTVNNIVRHENKKLVQVKNYQFLTDKVVIATNGYTTRNFSFLGNRVYPVPSFIIATEPLNPSIIKCLAPGKHMMVETRSRACYFRLSSDEKRLLFGGRASLHMIKTQKASSILQTLMIETFPILKNKLITHSWTGWTGFTFSRLPHVGCYEGLNFALGYSGNGVALSPYLGHKAALQALNKKEGETSFSKTKFNRKFYYYGRPWFLPIASIGYRIKDILENKKRTIRK